MELCAGNKKHACNSGYINLEFTPDLPWQSTLTLKISLHYYCFKMENSNRFVTNRKMDIETNTFQIRINLLSTLKG